MRREIHRNSLEGFPFILRNEQGSLGLQDTHDNLENTSITQFSFDSGTPNLQYDKGTGQLGQVESNSGSKIKLGNFKNR